MGAFAALGAGIEKGLGKIAGEETAELFRNSARSMDHTFNATDVGRYTKSLLNDYKQGTDQAATQLAQQGGAFTSQYTKGQAKAIARAQTFGKDDKALTTLMKISHEKYGYTYTQNLMDHVAMQLHEDSQIGATKHASEFKANARKEIGTLPQFKNKDEITGDRQRNPYTIDSPYHKPGATERYVTNFIYSRFSPLIVIPHLGTSLNVALATQTTSFARALAESISGQTPAQVRQTFIDSGIMAESTLRNMQNSERIRNGIITKHLPGSAQDVLSKVTSTPGFNYLRDFQTSLSGSASYYDAISYGEQFARRPGDKLIAKRLEQYGMKQADLAMIKATGKLTQDQLERAVYHGVNRQIFLDTSLSRSFNAQRNGLTRAFTMYHGYVSQQAKFLGEEFATAFRGDTKSIGGVAKFLATTAAVFPAAGEALKIGEMVGRGQWNQVGATLNDDYDSVTFQKGDSENQKLMHFLTTWGEAQASLGSFGIAYGLIQGAYRGYLAESALGPIFGNSVKYLTDIAKAGGKGELTPQLGRDALEISLPLGLGRYAKHALLPTKREEKLARGGTKFPKLKGMSHFKKLSSLN